MEFSFQNPLSLRGLESMQRILSAAQAILCSAALTAGAFAQGGDNCASPTTIAGPGTFPFNNVSATTGPQGQNNALCNQFGTAGINHDVWFSWTAATTGDTQFDTCNGPGLDTKMAVYSGAGCPSGAPLVCNDDSCNLNSSVHTPVIAGNVYMVQLGVFPGTSGGTGNLTITAFTPPPPCSGSTGPDVIVGEVSDIENEGPTGALDAISLGTTSCNIGTVNLGWHANTNQHPVIGGCLYRYRVVSGSGRFEQIGMSWLKHGFFALSNEVCCTNCQATDGSELGVNCADPYTANRNGSQSGLGPRYQVNAHTGFFVYPPANPPFSGTTARRCEYLLTDVDLTAGVHYYGECQYITPDDAAAGNQNNNASYKELNVSGAASNPAFSFAGSTHRAMSAIRAWPTVDSGAVINDVQVAGDGLFLVGFHATNLGGGQFHYEYAVYNMNGDRCGGSFSIPIPAGVTVSNIGFHDVTYRNGDGNGNNNFSSTDWTATQAGGALTWACETQAVNANANALRWGTTYNFRFDANTGPTTGAATIGLWKTGSPSNVTTNVDVPSGGATSFAYCFGDGSGTACPCGNNSSPFANAGCLNSLGSPGQLVATGSASVSADTLVLSGTGMPNGAALYFQGTTQVASGAGVVFGDGLRCAGGTTIRLGNESNVAGASQYPSAGDPPVHIKGADAVGNSRTYQCWYRNAAVFCSPDTFNLSNGWSLIWLP
jgi:hypothetical protein